MIELPRACIIADEIADDADFFSFGTNDLTQTTLGLLPRRRRGQVPDAYLDERIVERNPFETLDVPGVGELVRIARRRAAARPRPTSSWASAVSTGATRPSSTSASEIGLDYVDLLAVPRADRARWRPRRRRSPRPESRPSQPAGSRVPHSRDKRISGATEMTRSLDSTSAAWLRE